jgi:predicted membrane protein
MSDRLSAGVAALFLGILHGFAGSGGVLGVVPAVQLHDWKLATLYLGTFCLISTLVMGVFAAFYGTVCAKLTGSADKREFIIEMFSSCLSIVVGIVWLVLSPMGKLEVLG